jgi:hypothetical protein
VVLSNPLKMTPELNKKTYEESGMPADLPFISIIIPFEPKMNIKSGFDTIIDEVASRTEKEVLQTYPESEAIPVIQKMRQVLHNLDLSKHKKQSIGIFVSPLLEKIYYFKYQAPPDDLNHPGNNCN